MRYIALLLTLFLIPSIIQAQSFKLDEPHYVVMSHLFNGNEIFVYPNPTNNTYYLVYSRDSGSNDACIINSLDSSFTSISTQALAYDSGSTIEQSCSARNSLNGNGFYVAGMWRIGSNPWNKLATYLYNPTTETLTTISSSNCVENFVGFSISVTENGGLFLRKCSGEIPTICNLVYGNVISTCSSIKDKSSLTFGGNVIEYGGIWKALYCGGKYHIFTHKSGGLLYDYIMKYNGLYDNPTFIKAINVETIKSPMFDVYCDQSSNNIYLVSNEYNNPSNISIWRYGFLPSSNTIYEISYTEIDGTQINYPFNIFEFPYWSFNQDSNKEPYLSYTSTNGGDLGLDILVGTNYCTCNSWKNVGCVNELMNQTRYCNPTSCSQTERLVVSDYCEKEYNRTKGIYEQKYTTWSNFTKCYGNVVQEKDVGAISECDLPAIVIPSDCVMANVTVRVNPIVNYDGYCGGSTARLWYEYVCSPTYSCEEDWHDCRFNITAPFSSSVNISSGEISTAKVKLQYDSSCQCRGLFGIGLYGVKGYYVEGIRNIVCSRPCQEENVCLDSNYKATRHIDCSMDTAIYCEYGCLNGQCQSSLEEQQNKNPLDISFFNNPTNRFFAWLGIILVVDIILYIFFSSVKTEQNIITTMIIIATAITFLMGVILGWLPVWIPILIFLIAVIIFLSKR